MSSRDKILETVKKNQPAPRESPPLPAAVRTAEGDLDIFVATLESIGGTVYFVSGYDRIATIVRERFPRVRRIVSACAELAIGEKALANGDPHALENVDLAILPAHFGVAENGACWVTEEQMVERVLPFIAQHLALVLSKNNIVADMHAAYERIAVLDASRPYGFASFIAGPSKTADIEQSLVLGAHGPASLTVFLIDGQLSDAGFF
jgi:L-lactate dehydrogenase complex protein LldG